MFELLPVSDVNVSGGRFLTLTLLVRRYEGQSADLLNAGCETSEAASNLVASKPFLRYVGGRKSGDILAVSPVPVARLSAKLINELHVCSRKHVSVLGSFSMCSLATKAELSKEKLAESDITDFTGMSV